ncbi:Signal peptidase I [Candidatus Fokinia solitaria]|uniref:Signal peptidase I n=1 Tax=Candidatus Fokinia solitaria TaxID=1802984 RepID=A0A2U8BRE4_9RICK|nr:signal peptidase I [Candidatus Fokinia solitaria]AWD32912.1 Signal peptidase I [Candidatus Fokinia solitaria]
MKSNKFVNSVLKPLLIALLLSSIIRNFIFENFEIPSSSMVPSLLVGDVVMVSKFSYGYGNYSSWINPHLHHRIFNKKPRIGDVIVFHCGLVNAPTCIKRLIAMEGDVVRVHGVDVYVNNVIVEKTQIGDGVEDCDTGKLCKYREYTEKLPNGKEYDVRYREVMYVREKEEFSIPISMIRAEGTYVVPQGKYFFMGDNRDNSNDSRNFNGLGMVDELDLIGRAECVIWNTDKIITAISEMNVAKMKEIFRIL